MANGVVNPGSGRGAVWAEIANDNRARAAEVRPLGTALAAKIAADCEQFARIAQETVEHYRTYDNG